MRTTLHHQDGAISATVSDHDDFCVLAFRQGVDTMHIHLPHHMTAAAHMIVDAFNSNMKPAKPVLVQAGDPVDGPLQSYVMLTDGAELFGKAADDFQGGKVAGTDYLRDEFGNSFVPFPSGGALPGDTVVKSVPVGSRAALAIVVSNSHVAHDPELDPPPRYAFEQSDGDAAHAVERRDLP